MISSFVPPLALVLAAREWGWIRFELPERKRQTEKGWAHEFGFVTASAMWGFHIGIGFTTYMTHGGFWVLVAMALAVGEPTYGAVLMLVYWLGRAMSVWMSPTISSGDNPEALVEAILANRSMYHWSVGFALLRSAALAALLFTFEIGHRVPWM